ncbi:hypothetical protein G5714_004318 [Onychostoma macrolepis]|uniref:Uncharacterized protein n=1 Tax=Onychostoma macrolepis TaxID=369639 RepID=A0A7J6D4S1_9TELE|nr:hypothetical protein G5714_004318 [Onychostoma macrolepis]
MAYLRNWRKRNAEVLALAENSSEEDEMLGNVDEEVLSPTLSPDHSDIDVVLSSDSETPNLSDESSEEAVPDLELEKSTKHRRVAKETFTRVSTTLRDGCFLLDNEDFAFVKEKRSDGSLVCDVIHHNDTESFFDDPCDSRLLNIVRVRDLSRAKRQLITRHTLHRKVVCLPPNHEATNSGLHHCAATHSSSSSVLPQPPPPSCLSR